MGIFNKIEFSPQIIQVNISHFVIHLSSILANNLYGKFVIIRLAKLLQHLFNERMQFELL